nr:LysM domain-containing protein [uncultured Desulfobulbus sp.]
MSTITSSDIQALIDTGHITEAGTLLTMHGDELSPHTREDLETRHQQQWNKADALIAQGEEHEFQGKNREAQECYQQAAKIAVDFPGLQERRKRITETLALTDAVRLRSKRIRTQVGESKGGQGSGKSGTSLLLGALFLALSGGGWWYMYQQNTQPDTAVLQSPASLSKEKLSVTQPAPTPPPPPQQLQEQRLAPRVSAQIPVAELGAQILAATTDTVEKSEADAQELVQSLTDSPLTEHRAVTDQQNVPEEASPDVMPAASTPERQDLLPEPSLQRLAENQQTEQVSTIAQNTPKSSPEPVAPKATVLPPAKPVTSTALPPKQKYTVMPGDSLSKIAKRLLCNEDAWLELYARNKKLIDNPDILLIGTQLDLHGLINRCPGNRTP